MSSDMGTVPDPTSTNVLWTNAAAKAPDSLQSHNKILIINGDGGSSPRAWSTKDRQSSGTVLHSSRETGELTQ